MKFLLPYSLKQRKWYKFSIVCNLQAELLFDHSEVKNEQYLIIKLASIYSKGMENAKFTNCRAKSTMCQQFANTVASKGKPSNEYQVYASFTIYHQAHF